MRRSIQAAVRREWKLNGCYFNSHFVRLVCEQRSGVEREEDPQIVHTRNGVAHNTHSAECIQMYAEHSIARSARI